MTEKEALNLALEALETLMIERGSIYDKAITAIKEALAQPEPMRLRRGDILRCIETDELCTVWSTSTTGKTLIKWGANDFGGYTAEQIGELFWLEPSPDDLELAAEKSDNYAAFHAGYRFAVAHPLAQPEQDWSMLEAMQGSLREHMARIKELEAQLAQPEQEPVAWMTISPFGDEDDIWYANPEGQLREGWTYKALYEEPPKQNPLTSIDYVPCCTDQTCPKCKAATPPQRTWVGLTEDEIQECFNITPDQHLLWHIYQRIEAKLKEKNT